MTASERILKVMECVGVTKIADFSKEIGVERHVISDVKNGKIKKFSSLLLESIVKTFPQFNRNWLLYGEGEMLRGEEAKQMTHGGNSPAVMGERNVVDNGCSADIMKLAEMHKEQIARKDEQIDRLLSIIEKMQG